MPVQIRVPMTPNGKTKLVEELSKLKTAERLKIVAEIETARSHGDLSENAEYHAAKERQGQLEARIRFLEDQLSRAEVIDPSRMDPSRVIFGMTVRLYDPSADKELSYRIVGELEADLGKGYISVNSPIAKALIGKNVGDVVEAQVPGGRRELEIIGIKVD
ncbi:MAG: transcription elongation factor GreA [Pseudomonadota bacterium]